MITLTQPHSQQLANGYSPETELLLCCSRNTMDKATAERINVLLEEDINWAYLIQAAAQHRVMPLLCQTLNNINSETIPKAVQNKLQSYFQINTFENLLRTEELNKLLNLFQHHSIPAIPFKGAALAICAYNNLALRQFHDLDILVKKADTLNVQELLLSQGYVCQRKGTHLTPANYSTYMNSPYHYDTWYYKTLNHNTLFGTRVEIHWATTPQHIIFPLNPQWLWQHLEPLSIAGMTVLSLPPADLLPLLCVNYTKDHWTQLKMICDIAELIHRHQDLDWQQSLAHAKSLGRERTLYLGLFLAHNLFGTTLPQEIWQQMQAEPVVQILAAQVCQRIFANRGCDPGILEKTRFNFRLRERLQDKVRYMIFSTFKVLEQRFTEN